MAIKPLPGDVVAQIKSSVVITSLNNVICGLIKNSLDAAATKINVSIDYSRGNCTIEDNGHGIQPEEFSEDGGLGQLHYTSKYPPQPHIHGTSGVFIAAVASLSLLSITSHHRDFHSHNSMSLHNSKVLSRHTPCPPHHRILSFTHGTRVTVRDLFGSMPVRVKHRALQAEKSSFTRESNRLVLEVVALLLAWPGTVSVAIRGIAGSQDVNFKSNTQSRNTIDNGCHLLYQALLCDTPNSSEWITVGASAPTLSISGFVCREPVATKSVQFLSFGIEPISNESRSNVLYEEINKLFADSSFGVIEHQNTTCGPAERPNADSLLTKDLKAKKGVDRWPMFFLQITPISLSNLSMKVDDVLDDRQPAFNLIIDLLKAMFYEFLKKNHCQPRAVTLSTDSRTDFPSSLTRTSASGSEDSPFSSLPSQERNIQLARSLSTASFDPRDRKAMRHATPDSRPTSLFAPWSKVKSGQMIQHPKTAGLRVPEAPSPYTSSAHDPDRNTQSQRGSTQRKTVAVENARSSLYDANGKLTRKPFEDLGPCSPKSTAENLSKDSLDKKQVSRATHEVVQDNNIECINPISRMAVSVNARTGFSTATKPLTLSRRASKQKDTRLDCESVKNDPSSTSAQPWIQELVSKWKNPTFELTEEPILKLPDLTEVLLQDIKPARQHGSCGQTALNLGTRFETSSLTLRGRVSKQTLSQAKLIAQVDHKFIFAKMPLNHVNTNTEEQVGGEQTSGLFLIDQHAADERCRVEELMAGYFKPITDNAGETWWQVATEVLPKSVHFELPFREESILRQAQQYFSYWGVMYELEIVAPAQHTQATRPGSAQCHKKVKLVVKRLPPAIIERCRTEPRLLAELIRKEAWTLNDECKTPRPPRARIFSPSHAENSDVQEDVPIWVSLLHGCPPGILDLIDSRSCRSAIMFNDPLTLDQCRGLLERLSKCAFPFQCAHGRPSMIPVADLGPSKVSMGHSAAEFGWERNSGELFGQAYRRWKEKRQS